MLDHMIFNRLKWFNLSKTITTVDGKDYCPIPATVTVPKGTVLNKNLILNYREFEDNDNTTLDKYIAPNKMRFPVENASIINFDDVGKKLIYQLGPNDSYGDRLYVLADDCQIGGVTSLLSHLYQRFSYALSTFREAVRVW